MLATTQLMKSVQSTFNTASSPGSAIFNMVSGNIFGHTVPLDIQTPYIVWNVSNVTNDYTFDSILATLSLKFNIYDHSNSNSTVLQIGSALELLMDETVFTMDNGYKHVCNNLDNTIGPLYPEQDEIQVTQVYTNKIVYSK